MNKVLRGTLNVVGYIFECIVPSEELKLRKAKRDLALNNIEYYNR